MTVVAASRPFLDTSLYSPWALFWYVGGFLAWTPAYVVVIWRAQRRRELEIPVIAATANVTWEFIWGFVFDVDMGWGLQWVYRGAFFIDVFILVAVVRYGWKQATTTPFLRPVWPALVAAMIAGWAAFYLALEAEGYDLPLGSNSAYIDNVVMSALYLWFGLGRPLASLSIPVAWSKGIGTGMVTVFVFIQYPDNVFVHTLGIIVAVLDAAYLTVLYLRRAGRWPAVEAALSRPPALGGQPSGTSATIS